MLTNDGKTNPLIPLLKFFPTISGLEKIFHELIYRAFMHFNASLVDEQI